MRVGSAFIFSFFIFSFCSFVSCFFCCFYFFFLFTFSFFVFSFLFFMFFFFLKKNCLFFFSLFFLFFPSSSLVTLPFSSSLFLFTLFFPFFFTFFHLFPCSHFSFSPFLLFFFFFFLRACWGQRWATPSSFPRCSPSGSVAWELHLHPVRVSTGRIREARAGGRDERPTPKFPHEAIATDECRRGCVCWAGPHVPALCARQTFGGEAM